MRWNDDRRIRSALDGASALVVLWPGVVGDATERLPANNEDHYAA